MTLMALPSVPPAQLAPLSSSHLPDMTLYFRCLSDILNRRSQHPPSSCWLHPNPYLLRSRAVFPHCSQGPQVSPGPERSRRAWGFYLSLLLKSDPSSTLVARVILTSNHSISLLQAFLWLLIISKIKTYAPWCGRFPFLLPLCTQAAVPWLTPVPSSQP